MNYIIIIGLVLFGVIWVIVKFFEGISGIFSEYEKSTKENDRRKQAKIAFLKEIAPKKAELSNNRKRLEELEADNHKKWEPEKDRLINSLKNAQLKKGLHEIEHSKTQTLLKKNDVKVLRAIWNQYIASGALNQKKTDSVLGFVNGVLSDALKSKHMVQWDECFSDYNYSAPKPSAPAKKKHEVASLKPSFEELMKDYESWKGPFKKIYPQKFSLSDKELRAYYECLVDEWGYKRDEVAVKNSQLDHENDLAEAAYQNQLQIWSRDALDFKTQKDERKNQVKEERKSYLGKSQGAINDYIKLVLSAGEYPNSFPLEYEIDYNPENKSLILDYQLPSTELIPKVKEQRFLKTKNEYQPVYFKDSEFNKLYDDTLYKITLRTIHILFSSDEANALDIITFNGWVRFTNQGTGHKETSCILSLQATKKEFLSLNLANVEPKECFKSLKGVGSSKLYGLAAVKPILELNREDKRFVSSHGIDESMANVTNIAIMPWEEFEHLIRGLFEKEFSQLGGEVKVTRASRDGGVDAVVFDPDPIRGGKIVIQAKRYINTVELSAVRDLFGTVHSEGATKGILITTADYGPEAYEFAKGKPLTLLNGNNLLHLLAKHGHKAKIDLKEARLLYSENNKRQS